MGLTAPLSPVEFMLGGLYYTWKDNQKPFEPLTSFRVALGARRADIMRLILAEGGRLILAGTSIGLLAALALSRLLKSLLYTISPHDPLSFAAVTITLTTVALLATLLPARRAASVEPSAALRTE